MLPQTHLPFALGIGLMLGLGAFMLVVAFTVRSIVRNTHDFVIAGRNIGLGFGVGSVIAVWTWSMAVMMSSAQAYSWGTSGLLWFIVPNGLAVMAMVPFALRLRRQMPAGYTIVEFMRHRFASRTATVVTLVVMLFGLLSEIFINLFGTVLVMSRVFQLRPVTILLISLAIVTVYSYFGGLWTSAITATVNTLLITVPAAVVVLFVLHKVGGPGLIYHAVQAKGSQNFNVLRGATASAFGVSLALGLLASTMADQTFWQKVWAMKPANLNRTFLWGGLWFYPIPLVLGLLGLVGLGLGVTSGDLGSAGPGGIGPYVISHLGLPVVIIAPYVLIILNACYSSIDGAFSALSSIVAVDVVKPLLPQISEKRLFNLTKASIVIAGLLGGAVVLSGIDYINLVLTVFFIKSAFIIPLALAIFWKRTSGRAFVASVALSIIGGLYVRQTQGDLKGIITLLAISAVTSVAVSLLERRSFDYTTLRRSVGELEQTAATGTGAGPGLDALVPATSPE